MEPYTVQGLAKAEGKLDSIKLQEFFKKNVNTFVTIPDLYVRSKGRLSQICVKRS
jgi:hypothetical protein